MTSRADLKDMQCDGWLARFGLAVLSIAEAFRRTKQPTDQAGARAEGVGANTNTTEVPQ